MIVTLLRIARVSSKYVKEDGNQEFQMFAFLAFIAKRLWYLVLDATSKEFYQ